MIIISQLSVNLALKMLGIKNIKNTSIQSTLHEDTHNRDRKEFNKNIEQAVSIRFRIWTDKHNDHQMMHTHLFFFFFLNPITPLFSHSCYFPNHLNLPTSHLMFLS